MAKKVVFGLPKSGSRSLQVAVRQANDVFLDHRRYRTSTWTDPFERKLHGEKVVFVRNPLNRLYSAWQYLLRGGKNLDDKKDAFLYLRLNESFEEFERRVFDDTHPRITAQLHFRPINEWLYPKGEIGSTWKLVRLDSVKSYYPNIGHYNSGEYTDAMRLSLEACEMLRRVYEEEFVMYGRAQPQ